MMFSHIKFALDSTNISQRTVEICGSAIKKKKKHVLCQNECPLELLDPVGPTIYCDRSASAHHGEELHLVPSHSPVEETGQNGKAQGLVQEALVLKSQGGCVSQ